LVSSGSELDPISGFCEFGNETFGLKNQNFSNENNKYKPFKEGCVL
jgi:hypothetical protein